MIHSLRRAQMFCERFGLRVPILLAPMAGACPPGLSIAVSRAGGMGAAGCLLMAPAEMLSWSAEARQASNGVHQLNLWVPDPPPERNATREAEVRQFLCAWGPVPAEDAGDATPPDFGDQCRALLEARPAVASSIMGLFPPDFVRELKQAGIAWFATVATVRDAFAAEEAGADAIVAQGAEAGGHRGAFDTARAASEAVGLFSLLPAVADAVRVPVIAAGGIADARGIAAALLLGASAVQIGTGFLRCSEAKIAPAWADAIARTQPEETVVSTVFSGRPGRSIATDYVRAATAPGAPRPAPYPVQRGLTGAMRAEAARAGDVQRMQAWAGQSARLARAAPAGELVETLWQETVSLLSQSASS